MSSIKLLGTGALLFLLTAPRPAHAGEPGPTPGDKAMAEALFRTAKDLQADGKLSAACAKYAESHRLDPKPGTILNVATCHELEGRTATAWADYAEAATFALRARQPEREKLARAKVDELIKKLSYVIFRFPEIADLEILLDGRALTGASAGTRVPLDPGEHALEARAPGKVAWTSRVKVEPGPAERTVVVPPLADDEPVVVAPPRPIPAPPPPAAEPPLPVSDGSTQRAVGWVAMGIGAAALGAGGFFGIRTLSKKSFVDEHCVGSMCDDAGLQANVDAKDAATLSTIAFAVGGAAVLTGFILLVSAPSSTRTPTPSAISARTGVFRAVW